MYQIKDNNQAMNALCQLRDLPAGSQFFRVRAGKASNNVYSKEGYNRPNRVMGWKASFTCGRDDDISYSVELAPSTVVLPYDKATVIFDL